MILFNHLLECYLFVCIAVIVHELMHVLAARIIHLEVFKFSIGEEVFALKLGRVSISPVMLFGSGVVVSTEQLRLMSKTKKLLFFLSGIAGNAATALAGLWVMRWNPLYGKVLLTASIYYIVFAALPFCPWQSDMKQLRCIWN